MKKSGIRRTFLFNGFYQIYFPPVFAIPLASTGTTQMAILFWTFSLANPTTIIAAFRLKDLVRVHNRRLPVGAHQNHEVAPSLYPSVLRLIFAARATWSTCFH